MLVATLSCLALLATSTYAQGDGQGTGRKTLRSSHFGIPGQDASFDYVGQ